MARWLETARVATIAIAAALAAFPAVAGAEPATLVDDSAAHFALGSPDTNTWVVDTGAVQLERTTLNETFDAASLPSSLASEPWPNGPAAPTIESGALKVDGRRVNTHATGPGPLVVEFRATFAAQPFQNVGLGNTLNEVPWAIFSTGGGILPTGLYARTVAPGISQVNDPLPAGVDPLVPHTYRIEWSPTDVKYFVDGALVATHLVAITDPMRPIVSDVVTPGEHVKVDWLAAGPHHESGTYESRVLDAGDERAVWGSVVATEAGGVALETRSGKTAMPDGTWSPWAAAGADGAIASPIGRYIQYRATLARNADGTTPALEKVELGFEIDSVAPTTSLDPVEAVNALDAGKATISFSTEDDDVARFQCSLDDLASFAPCVSPHQTGVLDNGTHTIYVRAIDLAGNVENPKNASFLVDVDPPTVTFGALSVVRGTATVNFTSEAQADLECSVDDPAGFEDCDTPTSHAFSGLAAGSHTVYVRATDGLDNSGVHQRPFNVDLTAPTAGITDVAVAGGTATVSFSSPDTDIARYECRLGDSGAFTVCSSPQAFDNLAPGSYSVHVQAVDTQGNTGAADRDTFEVASPSGGGGTVADTTAPDLAFLTKSVRASRKGDVKLRVKCPAGELRCVVTVVLKQGRKTVGSKGVTVLGGREGSAKVRLARAAKRKLAAAGKLDLKAVVTVRDHVGNAKQTTYSLKVKS